jgi:hypothetical protein
MAERDWLAIASEYIEGDDSLRALAKKHAIPWSTLRDRARREAWEMFRRDARAAKKSGSSGGDPAAAHEKTARENDAERIFRVTDKLVRRAEEILDGGGELGARELGELMRAIKNAKEIKMLRSALDEREQQARVRALEDKNEPPRREALRIEFSSEAEEASR